MVWSANNNACRHLSPCKSTASIEWGVVHSGSTLALPASSFPNVNGSHGSESRCFSCDLIVPSKLIRIGVSANCLKKQKLSWASKFILDLENRLKNLNSRFTCWPELWAASSSSKLYKKASKQTLTWDFLSKLPLWVVTARKSNPTFQFNTSCKSRLF